MWRYLVFLMVCLPCMGDGFRTFTDTQGRETNAKIVKVDARSGKVTLERENRRKATVPINVFSAEDQTYMREWVLAQDFMSNSKLRISIEKEKEKATGNSTSGEKRAKPPCYYTITLDNRSGKELKNMQVYYRLFWSTDFSKGDTRIHREQGSFGVERLADRSKKTMETEVVKLYRRYESQQDVSTDAYGYSTYSTSYNKVSEDDVEGLRARVIITLPSGNKFTREISEPSSLSDKYSW